jgi:hypothetical protein
LLWSLLARSSGGNAQPVILLQQFLSDYRMSVVVL